MEHHQLNLFANTTIDLSSAKSHTLNMDAQALARWKSQIAAHQRMVRESQPPQQTTLFDITRAYSDPDAINPFTLKLQPMSFYRMPTADFGSAAVYFILDNAVPLIFYIGETCRSNKRWKGVHGCKGYIESYQDLHYRYGLQTAVNIAFWWDAPVDRKARQELELSLILRWRSAKGGSATLTPKIWELFSTSLFIVIMYYIAN